MPSVPNSLYWRDRAEEARIVVDQLTHPGAKKAVLQLAESYERLARAAETRTTVRNKESPAADSHSSG